MLRADCKVLNLWNGTTNTSPPSGWEGVSFDDSGWSSPPSATMNIGFSQDNQNGSVVTISPSLQSGGAEAVGIGTTSSNKEQFLVRWRFDVPEGFVTDNLIASFVAALDSGGNTGIVTGTVKINDSTTIAVYNAAQWQSAEAALVPGAENLFAWHVNSNSGDTTRWNGNAWLAAALESPEGVVAVASGRRGWAAVIG